MVSNRRQGDVPMARIASRRMSAKADDKSLRIHFADGVSMNWSLPDPNDKDGIRQVRDAAMTFAKENGATIGQQNAVRKALTNAGYYLTKTTG
jgi:hypothetical protein